MSQFFELHGRNGLRTPRGVPAPAVAGVRGAGRGSLHPDPGCVLGTRSLLEIVEVPEVAWFSRSRNLHPRKDSNPRPTGLEAAALPLSYGDMERV